LILMELLPESEDKEHWPTDTNSKALFRLAKAVPTIFTICCIWGPISCSLLTIHRVRSQ
jgi:hypothetical protein